MNLLVAVVVLSAGYLAVVGIRSARLLRVRRLDSGFLLMYAAVVLPSAAMAVGVLLDARNTGADAFYRRTVVLEGPAAAVLSAASPAIAAISVLVVLHGLRSRRPPIGMALALSALLVALLGYHQSAASSPSVLVNVLLIGASAFARPGEGARQGVAMGVLTLAFLGGLAAAVNTREAFGSCVGAETCSPANFSGIADNKNAMGLLLAIGIPFVWTSLPVRPRRAAATIGLMVVATGSATAIGATAVGLAALLSTHFRAGHQGVARQLGNGVALASLAAVVALPLVVLSDDRLTGRPGLWRVARQQILAKPALGHGPGAWRSLVEVGAIPRAGGYSTHNQVLEILHVGGLVALICFVAVSFTLLVRAGRQRRMLVVLVIPMLVVSVVERPWSLGQVDWLSWTLPAALLSISPGPRLRAALEVRNSVSAQEQLTSPLRKHGQAVQA